MRKIILVFALGALSLATVNLHDARAVLRVGGGVHYLRNLGDIKEEGFKQDSFAVLGSVKANVAFLAVEGQLEYIFDYLGTDEAMFIPWAWAMIGSVPYFGAGVGLPRFDGEFMDDPVYALRAGAALALSALELDVYATYNFLNNDDLEAVTGEDLNAITFAAVLRFGL